VDLERLRYYTAWTHYANRQAYESPADPWKLLSVAPGDVEWYTDRSLKWGLGRVEGGSWDREQNCRRLAETTTMRALRQRFEEGVDWEETVLYRRAAEQFEEGTQFRGYGSLSDFRQQRCAYLDDLYDSIASEGYRANREAGHENPHATSNQFEDAYVHKLEPLVAIGREGRIRWVEGYHRLGIASILGIDEIPVQVLCRHEGWQEIRDRVGGPQKEGAGPGPGCRGHPDLADVCSGL